MRKRVQTAVPFATGIEDVNIPAGKRVVGVTVSEHAGRETVQITVEDVPALPPALLAEVTVDRG